MKQSVQIFFVFLKLGLISFGGPIAHISYFHDEFVMKRKWLSDSSFQELVSLCQFLPGPASSQLGISIGAHRSGLLGAIFAFLGFTLPAAVIMLSFAQGQNHFADLYSKGMIHGLHLAAVAVILQALWQMGNKFSSDRERILLMIVSASLCTYLGGVLGQFVTILLGAFVGYFILNRNPKELLPQGIPNNVLSKKIGVLFLTLFLSLLFFLPVWNQIFPSHSIDLISRFYRIGSFVFGGGHVVLSLIEEEFVQTGIVSYEQFLSGYGFAQAIPGPLFSISMYLGILSSSEGSIAQGIYSLLAIFLPGFLLILGIQPFWEEMRNFKQISAIMSGINASVVGLLLAVLYQPLFVNTVKRADDFYLVSISFVCLLFWRMPTWAIVVLLAMYGHLFPSLP